MFISISDVQVGDVIIDGEGRMQSRTTVKKVERNPNSCIGKVHINEKDCWEGFAQVRLQEARPSEEMLEDHEYHAHA